MPSIEELKQSIRVSISKNSLEEVFNTLRSEINPSSQAGTDLTLLQARFNQWNREAIIQGSLLPEEKKVQYNQILQGLTAFLDRVETTDLKSSIKREEFSEEHLNYRLDLQRLEAEGLKSQADLLIRKLNFLKDRFLQIQGTDAAQEFKLEEQIREANEGLNDIKDQLQKQ